MKTIFIGNYKGGVGKTTSTLFLGKHLKDLGHKVLLLDLDPQGSLSEICIKGKAITNELEDIEDHKTLNYVYDLEIENIKKEYNLNLTFNYDDLIHSYEEDLDFIPTNLTYKVDLGLDELNMSMEKNIKYFSILAKLITNIKNSGYVYDYLLIDCPPNSNIVTQSAFLLSDYYLIPTVVDSISTRGIIHYIESISKTYNRYCVDHPDSYLYKHYFGEKPKVIGVFYTLIRAQVNYATVKANLENELATLSDFTEEDIPVFESYTNNYVDITRAIATNTLSNLKVGQDTYGEIAQELLSKID